MQAPKSVRFGLFEADFAAGELRNHGRRVKLQDQPFQLLALLIHRAGQVVTREEVQKALWPADTFVEFEQCVNTAIKEGSPGVGRFGRESSFYRNVAAKRLSFHRTDCRP